MITSLDQLDPNQRYTYADYLTWRIQERVELIKGYIRKMAPAPNRRHQLLVGELFFQLRKHLGGGSPGQVFPAPFDVRLPKFSGSGPVDTVVQPDITVVCDPAKLDQQGCNGAPDLVVEVLSPGNSRHEMKEKYELYKSSGVAEYWVVDPEHEALTAYRRNATGQYKTGRPLVPTDLLTSEVLPGFALDLAEVFGKA